MASRRNVYIDTSLTMRRPNNPSAKWDRPGAGKDPPVPPKGTRKLPEPVTGPQMALILLLHICRRILLPDIRIKLVIYAVGLFVGSLIGDFGPVPRTFLANKHSVLNVYFVKLGWGWTLLVGGAFVALTSYVYCCANRTMVARHLSRLAVATCFWFVCTNLFSYIERLYGFCDGGQGLSEASCVQKKYRWKPFDISGHAFLLIYCNLILYEEAKSMRGWENINDLLMNHEHDERSPLKSLTPAELLELKTNYEHYSLPVKCAFIAMTVLSILWDFMLLGTILYFHNMAQKVSGGLFAIASWIVTYRMWYQLPFSPGLPGQGKFRYSDRRPSEIPSTPMKLCAKHASVYTIPSNGSSSSNNHFVETTRL